MGKVSKYLLKDIKKLKKSAKKLKKENKELTRIKDSLNDLNKSADNKQVDDLEVKCEELTCIIAELEEENKELSDSIAKIGVPKVEFKEDKRRSFFEIAATEREFKVGEVVHYYNRHSGLIFNLTIGNNETKEPNYPISILLSGSIASFTRFGKYNSNHEVRVLFSTEELEEMGVEIPKPE